ncbi:MAG: hypothetical protein ABL903_18985 [Methylococcales bacterium]
MSKSPPRGQYRWNTKGMMVLTGDNQGRPQPYGKAKEELFGDGGFRPR